MSITVHHHYHDSAPEILELILTKLTCFENETRRNFQHVDEQIDQLNQTADQELAAEQDLATEVHSSLDLITAEATQLTDLAAQLAALQAQQAGGVVVPLSKITALQTKMTTSLANIQTQAAALKSALPPPPPPPPPPPVAPTITTTALPNGTDGAAYSFQLTATGDAPIAFSATNLPPWASLASDGTITGTAVAGTSSIAVTATNAAGSVTSTLTLTVDPAVPAGA